MPHENPEPSAVYELHAGEVQDDDWGSSAWRLSRYPGRQLSLLRRPADPYVTTDHLPTGRLCNERDTRFLLEPDATPSRYSCRRATLADNRAKKSRRKNAPAIDQW